MLTDQQIATMLMAMPFLALCAGGLVAQFVAIRSEVARLRSVRVAKKERA